MRDWRSALWANHGLSRVDNGDAARLRPVCLAIILILAAAVAVGLYSRIVALDDRPFAVDEYYFAQSVRFILESGLPEFPSGGYYTRGILEQYLTALSVLTFGDTEASYRLPALLFNLGAVVLSYFYSRRFVPEVVALAIALTLLLSSWQIEFAQFARMYAPLQFLTLLFLIALDDAVFAGQWKRRYLPHLCLVLAQFTHALAVLFIPFLFVPFVVGEPAKRLRNLGPGLRYGTASVGVALFCLFFTRFDFRDLGISNRFPEDYDRSQGSVLPPFYLPEFPFWTWEQAVPIALLLLSLIAVASAILLWRRRRDGWRHAASPSNLLLLLLILSAALHLFLVSTLLVTVLVFRYRIHRTDLHPKRSYLLLAIALLAGAGWLGYALTTSGWMDHVAFGDRGLFWSLHRTFFGWPNLYHPLYHPWSDQLPVIGALTVGALVYLIVTRLRDPLPSILRSPAFVVLYIVFCFGVLRSPLQSTRYAFHIYPLMLCTIALAFTDLSGRLARLGAFRRISPAAMAAALYLIAFGLSRDFSPAHIANIAENRVAFRLGEFARLAPTWYWRSDYRGPAEFANEAVPRSNAVKLIVIDQPPVSWYLSRDHAVYYRSGSHRFGNVSRSHGTIDLWSNNRLLSTYDDLRDYTADADEVWLIRGVPPAPPPVPIEEVWNDRLVSYSQEFVSADDRIEVVKVRLRDPGEASRQSGIAAGG